MTSSNYPKRLIEVDLPIKQIRHIAAQQEHAARARVSSCLVPQRPLAACRAVICAALWPDPVDLHCPQRFRDEASRLINEFARKAMSDKELAAHCSRGDLDQVAEVIEFRRSGFYQGGALERPAFCPA